MRSPRIFVLTAAAALAVACGPKVVIDGEISGDGFGAGADGSGDPSGGSGAGLGTGSGAGSGSGAGAGSSGSGAGSGGGSKKEWAKAFGASGHQHLRALAADHEGNVIAAGSFDGELDPGTGPLDPSGVRSAFVLALSPKGKVLWSQTLTADDCAAEAVAVSAADEVLVTGSVKGSLHVGGAPAASSDGIFVVKLGKGGAPIWARTYGSSASMQADRGLSIAALPDGGAVVSGSFVGSLTIDVPVPADHGVFVAALSSDGHGLWASALKGTTGVVAVRQSGRILAATNDGDTIRVHDLDPTGAPGWSKHYAPATISAVAVDAADDVLLAGSTTTADFGGGPLPSPLPNGEAFLVSLDPGGEHRYTRGLPFDTTQSSAVALAVGSGGHVAVTGSYVHKVDGSTTVQSAFLATFDKAGAPLASHTFGPTDGLGGKVTQVGWGLAPAPAGGLYYLGGDFFTQIDVAGTTLQGDGTSDVFVAKLAP